MNVRSKYTCYKSHFLWANLPYVIVLCITKLIFISYYILLNLTCQRNNYSRECLQLIVFKTFINIIDEF